MPVIHEAVLTTRNDEPFTVLDYEPLESAKLFKAISDKIWEGHPDASILADWGVEATIDPEEAIGRVTGLLADINPDLVIPSGDQNLRLSGSYSRSLTLPSQLFLEPSQARIKTANWDSQFGLTRHVEVNGRRESARFTDGHQDYARDLSAKFIFDIDGEDIVLSYSMQRWQHRQDLNTRILGKIWYSGFAEQGYGGKQFGSIELSEQQEVSLLESFATIGGISLSGFNTANV